MSLPVLRRMLDRDVVNHFWQAARSTETPSTTECPLCRNATREIAAVGAEDQAVHLDVCLSCHSLWFDTHEFDFVEASAPAPPQPAEQKLPDKAREILALAEVERIRERAEQEGGGLPPDDGINTVLALFGFPVEENAPALSRWPFITWIAALLMVAVFAFQFFYWPELPEEWGFLPSEPFRHGGATLLTSFFLHGNWLHLAANVIVLLIFGDNVEDYLGHARYLLLLMAAALCGDVAHMMFAPQLTVPLIGASGGIAGVLVFYALRFPKARLVFALRYYWHVQWVRMRASTGLIFWLILQGVLAWQQIAAGGQVSGLAHLGGAAVGVVWWMSSRHAEGLERSPGS